VRVAGQGEVVVREVHRADGRVVDDLEHVPGEVRWLLGRVEEVCEQGAAQVVGREEVEPVVLHHGGNAHGVEDVPHRRGDGRGALGALAG
jgi:hypothetical protein